MATGPATRGATTRGAATRVATTATAAAVANLNKLGGLWLRSFVDDELVQLRQRNIHAIVCKARIVASFGQHPASKVYVLVQPGHTSAIHPDRAQVVVPHTFAHEGMHVVVSWRQVDAIPTVVTVLEHIN